MEYSGIPEQVLELHETFGFGTLWIFAALLGLRLAIQGGVIREKYLLALSLCLIGVIVLLVASYLGGDLVYGYGVGVMIHTGG